MENKIVKNGTQGYGYNYASLSDIAKQGYEIPKMKIVNYNDTDYVYYFDKELKDWMQGSRVVVPTGKGMNEAQLYGSALTYARRYTVLLALGLACDDDKEIENIKADGTQKTGNEVKLASEKQIALIKNTYKEKLPQLLEGLKITNLDQLDSKRASEIISKIMGNKDANK